MYFVTTNRPGYILFCMTPSERAAIGITEKQLVQVLVHDCERQQWSVLHEWRAADYSATDLMAALHSVEEPADPNRLLAYLPTHVRG